MGSEQRSAAWLTLVVALASGCFAPASECRPATCGQPGLECGLHLDGCGGRLECSECVPACVPSTCAQLGQTCGLVPDGCGGALSCGDCPPGFTCASGQCECVPEPSAGLCQRQGRACGTTTVQDACGARLVDCGACTAPSTCGGGGLPGQCGCLVTDEQFCVAMNVSCGATSGVDGCGVARVVDCGGCPAPGVCGSLGVPGECPPTFPCTARRHFPSRDAGVLTIAPTVDLLPLCEGEVLLARWNESRLEAVRVGSGKVIAVYALDAGPDRLALDEDAGVVGVTLRSPAIAFVDLGRGSVRTMALPWWPSDITFGNTSRAFVGARSADLEVAVVDTRTLTVLATHPVLTGKRVAYNLVANELIVADDQPWRARYAFDPITNGLTQLQSTWPPSFGQCNEVRVTGDGAHLLHSCTATQVLQDFAPNDIVQGRAWWSTGFYPQDSARFSRDSSTVVAARYGASGDGHAMVFATTSHAMLADFVHRLPGFEMSNPGQESCGFQNIDVSANAEQLYLLSDCYTSGAWTGGRLLWWKVK